MTTPFKGTINIDIRDSVPDWEPYAQPQAPEGAPNVLYVVLDDVGSCAARAAARLAPYVEWKPRGLAVCIAPTG